MHACMCDNVYACVTMCMHACVTKYQVFDYMQHSINFG